PGVRAGRRASEGFRISEWARLALILPCREDDREVGLARSDETEVAQCGRTAPEALRPQSSVPRAADSSPAPFGTGEHLLLASPQIPVNIAAFCSSGMRDG